MKLIRKDMRSSPYLTARRYDYVPTRPRISVTGNYNRIQMLIERS
jgi:hypothetical protein